MWSDPIQNAAIRGENIQKAKEAGISLEEFLKKEYRESVNKKKNNYKSF